ncbi:hypothetical protein GGE43_003965 [Agrobacterium tumefaciens]|uniref:Uncharacterized protein n=1 Tax=Agrobacterium radiobacter TaxID=362 RepID=A0ABR6JC41_AGRRD|nr:MULTISPECIES: hypothetical protein [Agrobacterium tumefaciens complex]MBB4320582.1 hypothetical protein [Agrobacterium radiobacter]MBB4337246.1 hypothetical protein [Agrobacterium radiobacter]MBB4492505.1 hypothetical protein [Agrobacterium radiobacter]MBB4497403.1 hypothetical protein [Agrobacterium radiobacter]MBB4502686.1 hypothetical protein [Agrobacterium radiobacter]
MKTDSCPIPTLQERSFIDIQQAAEQKMLEKVSRAISDAVIEVATNVRDAGLSFEPTSEGYFMFAVQQATFVRLCGGDPDTLRGGNPEVGDHVVQNCRNIIDAYWKSQSAHTTTR